jgi:hypothetical protein
MTKLLNAAKFSEVALKELLMFKSLPLLAETLITREKWLWKSPGIL